MNIPFPSLTQTLYHMVSQLLNWYSLTCFLSKDMDLLVESLRNQFLNLFFRLCCFLFLILNLLLFCHFLYFYCSILFCFFLLFFSLFSLLVSFLLLPFSYSLFAFAILTFSVLVFTAFHTLLDILLSLPLLFSSQFQYFNKQATVFLKSHSTSNHQSYQFPSSLYVSDDKYLLLLYVQLAPPC